MLSTSAFPSSVMSGRRGQVNGGSPMEAFKEAVDAAFAGTGLPDEQNLPGYNDWSDEIQAQLECGPSDPSEVDHREGKCFSYAPTQGPHEYVGKPSWYAALQEPSKPTLYYPRLARQSDAALLDIIRLSQTPEYIARDATQCRKARHDAEQILSERANEAREQLERALAELADLREQDAPKEHIASVQQVIGTIIEKHPELIQYQTAA